MRDTLEMPKRKMAIKKITTTSSKIVVAPTQTITTTVKKLKVKKVKLTDPIKGYKKNPYLGFTKVHTTKTILVKMIKESKGCPFICTFVGKDGLNHTLSAQKRTNQTDEFGYIQVYSLKDKAPRLINPQTILCLRIRGVFYTK